MKGHEYKRAGVILTGIASKEGVQGSLFDSVDRDKHARLMEAMDRINDREVRRTVTIASQGSEPIRMDRNYLSKCPTTDWEDLIVVRAK